MKSAQKTHQMTIRINTTTYEVLVNYAQNTERSLNQAITHLINQEGKKKDQE